MTNNDKWDEVSHSEINIGDTIKRINIHSDGTRAEVSGVVSAGNYVGDLFSRDGFALARKVYPNTSTELFRLRPPSQEDLDAAFKFPTSIGAVIEVTFRASNEVRTFVHSGNVWHWSGTQHPASMSEDDMRRTFYKFKLISEGIN